MNRKFWALLSLVTILTCICGTMFNRIRNVPYAGHDNHGHVSFIAGGFQSQFQIESQIIAFLCRAFQSSLVCLYHGSKLILYADGMLAFVTIGLADRAPRVTSPKVQSAIILIYVGLGFTLYSFLLSIFRIKNGGYPFALPPFL